jgi:serine protease
MKINIIPVFLLVFSLMTSCQKEYLNQDDVANEKEIVIADESLFVQGSIRVKVDEGLANQIEASRGEDGKINSVQVKSMSAVLLSSGVKSITRTFPHAGKFEERSRKAGLHLWYDVVFDKNTPLTKAQNDFSSLPGVDEVELNRKIVRFENDPIDLLSSIGGFVGTTTLDESSLELPFDDPRLADQWHYHNPGGSSVFLAGSDINVFPVWKNYTVGNDDVIVSVVDGGIDYEHEDLASNMWINTAEYNGGRSADDDANGYRDDIYGYNFVTNSGAISAHDHGTHVAGTVAAVNNNGKGVSGVAGGDFSKGIPGVRLMSCQIFSSRPEDEDLNANTAAAIKYGADNGAVISQNSWGYEEVIPLPSSIKAAIDYFVEYAGVDEFGNQTGPMKGGIVIFAAGNENREESTPSSYEKVLSVASIGPDYLRATYSNYGEWVDISAPGGQAGKATVLSTVPNNGYGYKQGTSMACPHVSGVAALVISYAGGSGFTNQMLWDRLVNTTTDIYPYNRGIKGKLGSGMVNALGSIASEGTIPPQPVTELVGESNSNDISLKWLVTPDVDDIKAYGYTVYYSKNSLEDLNIENLVGVSKQTVETSDLSVGDTISTTLSGLDFETDYFIRIDAYDYSSNRSELSPMVVVTTEENFDPVITPLDGLSVGLKAFETKYLNFSYSDPDGHTMTWDLNPGSDAATALLINNNIQVKITGRDAAAGDYTGVLYVNDQYGGTSSLEFSYEIEENKPPILSNSPDDLYIGSLGREIQLDLDQIFSDADGERLSYTVTSSVPSVAHVNPNLDKLFITSLAYGLTEVTVTAKDALLESVSATFRILVRDDSRDVDVYPNPVIDKLNLRTGEEIAADVSIVASTGAKVYDNNLSMGPFNPAQIDMSELSGGVYTVVIKYNGKEVKQNITKL